MSANVKSTAAIRQFRSDLIEYNESLRTTLDMLYSELKRAVDYFESDRAAYWPAQVRRASDGLASARINLERCRVTTSPGEGPSCFDEKKALQRAKARLQLANEKVKATKKWLLVVRREVDEFQSRLAQMAYLSDTELPKATALLARLASRLDRYTGATPAASPGLSQPDDSLAEE